MRGTGAYRVDFRCDGNKRIASGHIQRCRTLAEAFGRAGCFVRFLVSDEESAALLMSLGLPEGAAMEVLGSYYRAPEKELPVLLKNIKENKTDFLWIDSYAVTREYLQSLKDAVPTGYIDDLHAYAYPATVLLQYTASGTAAQRSRGISDRCLTGAAYAPLREEFRREYQRLLEAQGDPGAQVLPVRERVERILVTTGGGDKNHMAQRIAQGFLDMEDPEGNLRGVELYMVQGALSGDGDVLQALSERDFRIKILKEVREMAKLMASADLAITAGGTTLYELCAMGVPSCAFVLGDDQARVMHSLEGVVAEAGVATDAIGAEISAQGALLWAARMCAPESTALRQEQSARMRGVTDGAGADRVAAAVLEYLADRRR